MKTQSLTFAANIGDGERFKKIAMKESLKRGRKIYHGEIFTEMLEIYEAELANREQKNPTMEKVL